jgi:hypothetical protein
LESNSSPYANLALKGVIAFDGAIAAKCSIREDLTPDTRDRHSGCLQRHNKRSSFMVTTTGSRDTHVAVNGTAAAAGTTLSRCPAVSRPFVRREVLCSLPSCLARKRLDVFNGPPRSRHDPIQIRSSGYIYDVLDNDSQISPQGIFKYAWPRGIQAYVCLQGFQTTWSDYKRHHKVNVIISTYSPTEHVDVAPSQKVAQKPDACSGATERRVPTEVSENNQ